MDKTEAIRGGEWRRKTGFPSLGASLPGGGWTDSLGLAPGSTGRAWSPAAPAQVSSPTLPSLAQYTERGEMGSREATTHAPGTRRRTEMRIKHVIEMVACGARGGWDKRESLH